VPAICPLNDPASRLPANAADNRRLATPADVRNDTASTDAFLHVCVIVSLVETAVHGLLLRTERMTRSVFQCRQSHPLVVDVRARQDKTERDSFRIRQDVPLRPALRAVRRVRARMSPPFGAFTITLSRLPHFQSMPFFRS